MIDTPQTASKPQRDQEIDDFYTEAKKWHLQFGNVRRTERGIFIQFMPRAGKREGRYGTFKNLGAFRRFLRKESGRKPKPGFFL